MASRHNTQRLGFRVFFGCVLGLILLGISPGEESYASRSGAASLLYQSEILCEALPPKSDTVRVSPGRDEGRSFCQAELSENGDRVWSISVSRADSVAEAQNLIDTDKKPGRWVPDTSFGDYGYEIQDEISTSSDGTSFVSATGGLIFRYACYVVRGSVGVAGKPPLPRDTIRVLARQAEQKLKTFPGCASGPPLSTSPTVVPTTTQADLDLTVDHMEVVQVVQTKDNKMPLVAGKKTLVRVFLKANNAAAGTIANNVTASLFVWPEGGNEVEIRPSNGLVNAIVGAELQREDINGSINFVIPPELTGAGVFTLKAVANPARVQQESNYDNNELTEPFEFMQRNRLRVGYIRIGSKLPGNVEWQWPNGVFAKADTFLRKLYPVADADIQYYELPFRARITAELNTRSGISLLTAMREFYDRIDKDRPDILFGWIANDMVTLDFGGLGRFKEPVAIGTDYNDGHTLHILAHEVGHDLDLDHTGTGTDSDPATECQKSYSHYGSSYWPKEYGGSARIREVGFDTQEMKVISPDFYDIMAYCIKEKTWISTFHYKRLYDSNSRPSGASTFDRAIYKLRLGGYILYKGDIAQFEAVRLPDANPGGGVHSTQAIHQGQGEGHHRLPELSNSVLSISGPPRSVGASYAASLLPLSVQREGTGNYCLRFMDAGGALLYERCFEPEVLPPVSEGEEPERGEFSLAAPDPGNVAKVVLVRNENGQEKELHSLTVSPHAPTLTITSPKAGDRWEGEHTITWTGSDEDGDNLRYDIQYSADGEQSWYPLELGNRDTQYTFSTDEILPSDQTYIRILASDGYNTTAADVGPLVIPKQANSPLPPSDQQPQPPLQPTPTPSGGPDGTAVALIIGGTALMVVVGFTLLFVFMRRSRTQQVMPGMYGMPGPSPQPNPQPWNPYPNRPPPPTPTPTALPSAIVTRFRWAEQEYSRLRGELATRRIHPQQYQAAVGQLRVQDARGSYWMLDVQSGRWLVYDGRGWVPADPYRQP
ncbi:MAG TPA: hypothetical protein VJ183_00985 [Chloroflexia bacterium]|nr:hypothetical protein [Chloroflexia bacterium]